MIAIQSAHPEVKVTKREDRCIIEAHIDISGCHTGVHKAVGIATSGIHGLRRQVRRYRVPTINIFRRTRRSSSHLGSKRVIPSLCIFPQRH